MARAQEVHIQAIYKVHPKGENYTKYAQKMAQMRPKDVNFFTAITNSTPPI